MSKKLVVVRNFLYRFFVIGFLVSILSQLVFFANNGMFLTQIAMMLEVSRAHLVLLVISLIALGRIFLVYLILCPALALHWTIKREKSLNEQS